MPFANRLDDPHIFRPQDAAPRGEISVSARIITQGPVPQAISNEHGCQEFLHLFCLFESFLFSLEHSDALARERPLAREGLFRRRSLILCPPYSLSAVSLHHLGIAMSSNLEDDFATKRLVESIDEKLLWPIYFASVSHKSSPGSAFLCCSAYVIDINGLTVFGRQRVHRPRKS